jgi:voltage-gated potassium channel
VGRLAALRAAMDPAAKGRAARAFRAANAGAVAVGLAAVVLGTVPDLAAAHGTVLTAMALLVSAAFALEYALRVRLLLAGGAERLPADAFGEPVLPEEEGTAARLGQLACPLALVDLLAAAGVPMALLSGFEPSMARLLGLVWILKPVRQSPALAVLARVVRQEREPLGGVLLAFVTTLLLAATAAYLLERGAQPGPFGSIPAALWWAVTTLTTTGYGDEVPATPLGRLLAGLVMVAGITVLALLAGILASGYASELRRRDFLRSWDLVAQVPLFASVGATTLAEVARLLRPRDLPAGRVVFRRGERGESMYFIAAGEVEVRVPGGPVRLGEGKFFGEMALITGEPRTATVVTTRASELLALDLADFRALAAARPELSDAIHAEAERRLADLQERAAPG